MDTSNRNSIVTVFPQSDRYETNVTRKRSVNSDDVLSPIPDPPRFKFSKPSPEPPVDDSFLFSSVSQANADTGEKHENKRRLIRQGQPRYQGILNEDQAGPCTVAYRMDPDFQLYASKSRTLNADQVSRLKPTSHPNLVNVQCFYDDDDSSVRILYECTAVSLAELLAIPGDAFREYEWAVVCEEVCLRALCSVRKADTQEVATRLEIHSFRTEHWSRPDSTRCPPVAGRAHQNW